MSATAGAATPVARRASVDLAAAIRSRELSAREVVGAHIALIERHDERLNALVGVTADLDTP
jgi:Asp-tRNA(Asn)/Glu-tRNA(Gln) amidotransferase A subunit family amidase